LNDLTEYRSAQSGCRSPSTRLSHLSIWFQLVKVWLTKENRPPLRLGCLFFPASLQLLCLAHERVPT
jgi:hypothetical protein